MNAQTAIVILLILIHLVVIIGLVMYFKYSNNKKKQVKQQYMNETSPFTKSVLEKSYATLKNNDIWIVSIALTLIGVLWYALYTFDVLG